MLSCGIFDTSDVITLSHSVHLNLRMGRLLHASPYLEQHLQYNEMSIYMLIKYTINCQNALTRKTKLEIM